MEESKWSPITKLENPKTTIKTEDWLGKEPNPQKSKMERGLNNHREVEHERCRKHHW